MLRALPAVLLVACSFRPSLTLERKPKEPISKAVEGGEQYVRIDEGVVSTREGIARRWKTAAKKVCNGDYLLLSEAGYEKKHKGIVVSRTHEGYVRCIAGDAERDLAEATRDNPSPPPPRRRR